MNSYDPFFPEAGLGTQETLVGEVVDAAHPSLANRRRVTWTDGTGEPSSAWALCLSGVVARPGDRVVLVLPSNSAEAVVVGVIDPVVERAVPAERGPALHLERDEALRIAGPDGRDWLEVQARPEGPRVLLLVETGEVSLKGAVTVTADALEFRARQGEIRMSASSDIRIAGETVHLN
jgi:hypothetical protein